MSAARIGLDDQAPDAARAASGQTTSAARPTARGTHGRSAMNDSGGNEHGAATVFVVSFAIVLLVLAGLVVDGGLALNARQRVADDVEQAARAGSERLDLASLRDQGVVRIDPAAAQTAARDFLLARGYPSSGIQVSTGPQQVSTRATIQQRTALLSLIFIDRFTVTASGQARPAVGITGEATP